MILILEFTSVVIFSFSIFFLLSKQLLQSLLGLILFSQAINLFLFTRSYLKPAGAPLVGETEISQFSDPLTQALILTAIVISFSVTAFAAILIKQNLKDQKGES